MKGSETFHISRTGEINQILISNSGENIALDVQRRTAGQSSYETVGVSLKADEAIEIGYALVRQGNKSRGIRPLE